MRPIYISVLVIYLFVPFILFYSFFIFVETLYILWIIDLLYSTYLYQFVICHLILHIGLLFCFVCHTEVLVIRLNLSFKISGCWSQSERSFLFFFQHINGFFSLISIFDSLKVFFLVYIVRFGFYLFYFSQMAT